MMKKLVSPSCCAAGPCISPNPSDSQRSQETTGLWNDNLIDNIILNSNFTRGLDSWQPICCEAYVQSGKTSYIPDVKAKSGKCFAIVSKRTECWQGLEQDITQRISSGCTYIVSAYVRVSGARNQETTQVQTTLRLEYMDSTTGHWCVGRAMASFEWWEGLDGRFYLEQIPTKVTLYFEGPSPGVDILIDSVSISSASVEERKHFLSKLPVMKKYSIHGEESIIRNPKFEDGLNNWSGRGCKILLHQSMSNGRVLPLQGKFFVSAAERTQRWHGIEQDITDRIQRKFAYDLIAVVRISGTSSLANVQATLRVQTQDQREQYIDIANLEASHKKWVQLHGRFLLEAIASRVFIYLDGPPAGTDILVDSLAVKHALKIPPSRFPLIEKKGQTTRFLDSNLINNIIINHDFSGGLHSWKPNCCEGYVVYGESSYCSGVKAYTGECFSVISNRTECWQGLEQDITSRVSPKATYTLSAYVRVWGASLQGTSKVQATLRIKYVDSATCYLGIGSIMTSKDQWERLNGEFSLDRMPHELDLYLEGPCPGVDILVDSVAISSSSVEKKKAYLFPFKFT